MKTQLKLSCAVIGLLLLGGCGQRGPLYLPEPAPQNQPSEPTTGEQNNEQGV